MVADIDYSIDPISKHKAREILRSRLGIYFKGIRYYFADDYYRCPSLAIAREIVKNSEVCRRRYVTEKHDCDDFTHLLKGAFIRDAYKDQNRRYPHAFGIVWGRMPAHAMNVVIVDRWLGKNRRTSSDRYAVYVIESQTGVFYRPYRGKLDEIYLILM